MMGGGMKCLRWFFYGLLLFTLLCGSFPLRAMASRGDFTDTYYFGPSYNSYRQFNSNGYIVYTYPQGALCFKMNYFDIQYICICIRRDMLVNNGSNVWGLYRSIANYDSSGNFLSGTPSSFFQMEGYSSDNIVTIDGVEYLIRSMEIATLIDSCPYFFAWSNRSEGGRLALEGYISGIKSYESGGTVNADVSVDTSNIESLISAGNTIRESIADDTLSIKESVSNIQVTSSFDDVAKENLLSLRIIVGCLFMCTMFFGLRNILLSWRRNTVK